MSFGLSPQLLLLLSLLRPALALPVLQIRNTVATLNEVARTVCVNPAPWNQILSFFLINYLARAATFKKTSGYSGSRDYIYVVASLFVPFVGISGAAATIARGSRFLGHTDVDRALLAEALCVIVREETWRPEHNEVIRGCVIVGADERGRRRMERRLRRRRRKAKRRQEKQGGRPQLLGGPAGHAYVAPTGDDTDDTGDGHSSSSEGEDEFCTARSFSSSSATLVIGPPGVQTVNRDKYKIHGHFTLPQSYCLAKLPPGTELMPLAVSRAQKPDIVISNAYNVTKSFTGIIQIISSLYALYSAYGSQVNKYGYAAFGFTVLPYTIMSVLNTIANLVEASYDCLFLVRSDVMLEAEHREGGEFVGEVAELVPATPDIEVAAAGTEFVDLLFRRSKRGTSSWKAVEVDDHGNEIPGKRAWTVFVPPLDGSYNSTVDPRAKIFVQPVGQSYVFSKASHKRSKEFRKRTSTVIMIFSLVIPYVVIGAISKFHRGAGSTLNQRVFMVGWLVVGQVIGALNLVGQATKARYKLKWWAWAEHITLIFVVVLGFAFAVGGFIEAGRMLRDFGYCIKL